jgi:hypothetical protein
MRMKFLDDDQENYLTDNKVQDMLYQPVRMTGNFTGFGTFLSYFRPQIDPVPAEAEIGICWQMTGYVKQESDPSFIVRGRFGN